MRDCCVFIMPQVLRLSICQACSMLLLILHFSMSYCGCPAITSVPFSHLDCWHGHCCCKCSMAQPAVARCAHGRQCYDMLKRIL